MLGFAYFPKVAKGSAAYLITANSYVKACSKYYSLTLLFPRMSTLQR
ncbi:hypothetical protein XAC3810_530207 [Xanthomonas citri pv. citri]|uniref:Uncharacterized protein n=1 Tax=Xanthomonas citri pv. citri TaxID=611301 RepID=A0A0U5FMS5_XANCI|nr:Hypothetical Protein XCAW_03337 [Xanthomonas citri subsp. citri Aw12879]CEE32541.1 hypothetical protein XAC9322_530207 [Xanthomonas citri pv. citri]CEE32864.1 hypothetical protein XAC3824_690002 [Xanthomonas citri pv. citri]CEE34067.1 hypothetical protein XAC1083_530183 [Xanthomonas citri pv. citri]CEE43418.1 hypothetical protein XAC3810_530207 [Xanthomonas citri pv. citri]